MMSIKEWREWLDQWRRDFKEQSGRELPTIFGPLTTRSLERTTRAEQALKRLREHG